MQSTILTKKNYTWLPVGRHLENLQNEISVFPLPFSTMKFPRFVLLII